jgi:DNA invertase Pin-like site-specific DNA recombinase
MIIRNDHQQMFKATQAREFDVLVIDDLSRFGRDQVETECVGRTSVHDINALLMAYAADETWCQ